VSGAVGHDTTYAGLFEGTRVPLFATRYCVLADMVYSAKVG
jgi:hypothetical protein